MTSGDRSPPLVIFDRCFSRYVPFRRFILNVLLFSCLGLPVVYLINHVGFALYAGSTGRESRAHRALAIDVPARIVLFLVAHAAIYAGSARLELKIQMKSLIRWRHIKNRMYYVERIKIHCV